MTDQVEIDAPEAELGGDPSGEEYDLFAELDSTLNPDDVESTEESEGEEDDDTSLTDDDDENEDPETDSGETVTIKVDGEEIEVTMDELKAGYSRQSDYTKKTQALAREREQMTGLLQLADALQSNPEAALAELARAFEVDLAGEPAEVETYDLDDPIERELKELREWRSEMEAERQASRSEAQDRALQNTLDTIKAENSDPDMDENALLQFAVDHQIVDLNIAYELKTAREGKAKPKADPPALTAKRNAPVVESSTRRGAKSGNGKIGSIADALRSALAESNG